MTRTFKEVKVAEAEFLATPLEEKKYESIWLKEIPEVTEEEIGDCFIVGDTKNTIVNRICDLFPDGVIKRKPKGTHTCH